MVNNETSKYRIGIGKVAFHQKITWWGGIFFRIHISYHVGGTTFNLASFVASSPGPQRHWLGQQDPIPVGVFPLRLACPSARVGNCGLNYGGKLPVSGKSAS